MKKIKLTKETLGLAIILIISLVLNLANLSIEGYGNEYYAAGVRSMTMSLKNFFFVSFDPAGFVTIDKPPLGFWIQAIFAKIFGYSGWSIILPQAIAGVISVWVIYCVVKRSFGAAAGLISALCLAVTPVFVAVSRNNTCDNLLVLTLLLACWALSIAAEKGKLKYLLLSLALVGVGFNIKMLQAYMVAPALYVTYLLFNTVSIKKRIVHLVAGTAILLAISFSWAVAVDLTPAANRPYVGSSESNSVIQLIVQHNGLERLGLSSSTSGSGSKGNPGGKPPEQSSNTQKTSKTQTDATSSATKGQSTQGNSTQSSSSNTSGQGTSSGVSNNNNDPGQGAPPNGGGQGQGTPPSGGGPGKGGNGRGQGGGTFGGQEKSSITRLFSNNSLSDQISWLFPIAVFGFIAAAIKEKMKKYSNNKRKISLSLWFIWMVPEFIYFSFTTGLFHPYYLTMLSAPIAALTGIGVVSMWKFYKEGGWKSWILPVALIADGLVQMLLISYYYSSSNVAKIIMIIMSVLCFGASLILIGANLLKNKNIKLKKIVLATALIGLLVAPTVWSSTAAFCKMSGSFPSSSLSLMTSKQMGRENTSFSNSSNSKLIEFLQKNKTNEKYVLVTSSTNGYASDIVIKTGEAVMTWGFFGNDNVITLSQFKELVNKGEVRYVMVGGQGGNNEIMNWVKANGKVVSESEWKDSNSKSQGFGGGKSEQLYDLKGVNTTSTTSTK